MNDSYYYYIIFPGLLIVMAILIPFFLKAEVPKPCKKSLIYKQTCSTVFLINALVAGLIGDFTIYAALMFIGLCCSWLGDYLLHVRQDPGFFASGLISFLVGHIFFTGAYCQAFKVLFPEQTLFSVKGLILFFVIVAAELLSLKFIAKISFGKMFVLCALYAATITEMAIKAFTLAISLMKYPSLVEFPIFTGIMLILGAVLFLFSDFTLSLLNFKDGVKKHGALRNANIWTYFYAQMFLGVTIFFIST